MQGDMDKAILKTAAPDMRRLLLEGVIYKAGLVGVTEWEIRQPLPQSTQEVQFFDIGTQQPHRLEGRKNMEQRRRLAEAVRLHGYANVMEETAYTWFNRLIALRYMEVNGYLPVRVLSSESGKAEPDIVTRPFEADLDFTPEQRREILALKEGNAPEALYRLLFGKQCEKLSETLPALFEKPEDDYAELLFSISYIKNGVLRRLLDIPEGHFRDAVQVIGWLYQYYNTEPKQAVFDGLKQNIKITRESIPAATQLFTPGWIVRYMVENSLGRLWLESHPNEALQAKWRYYLPEAAQMPEVARRLALLRAQGPVISPTDIKCIDPCMGSGHILAYAFDLLVDIYQSVGYRPRDAVRLILEHNLFGLDIDKRAFQLAYFALMMKARQYDRRILDGTIFPQVYHPKGWEEGEAYGALAPAGEPAPAPVKPEERNIIQDRDYAEALRLWNFRRLLGLKYDCVVTNPPYMGDSGMNGELAGYVKEHYPDSKRDLFACFIEFCGALLKPNGYQAMITMHAWMFLSSYEKLRGKLLERGIVNMAHLGTRAFEEIGGEVVQTTAFVLSAQGEPDYTAAYVRLVDYNSQQAKEDAFLAGEGRHTARQESFEKIPGHPVAYWMCADALRVFAGHPMVGSVLDFKKGMSTGDNSRFMRQWYEVARPAIRLDCLPGAQNVAEKWFPINSGGEYRKWAGNNSLIANWQNDGAEMKANATILNHGGHWSRYVVNTDRFFVPGIAWSAISSASFGARAFGNGYLFSSASMCGFGKERLYVLALLNSAVAQYYLRFLAPTMNYGAEQIRKIPYLKQQEERVAALVAHNIALSRADWDAFETSWDFKRHPLCGGEGTLADAFAQWQRECDERFNALKANEEALNRIFIGMYGLQNQLTPEVEDADVTVRRADLGRDIRSLVSYAVGCMFGRYSLDEEGLIFAGGAWEPARCASFPPDGDNVIPLTDEEYFSGDIVVRFAQFVRAVWGAQRLENNLQYIAEALYPNANGTAREKLRRYFLNDFYRDHLKIYQKRPIYWLFDSGKGGGFKALVYLHRIDRDTVGRVRVDYLHRLQQMYEGELRRALDTASGAGNARAVVQAQKRGEKLAKQLKDTKDYDVRIAHLALARTALDLDDGVKLNYEKLQTAADGQRYEVLGRI